MTTFFVRTPKPRPDFRSVAAFLWGVNHDYDSDGNCSYPADPNWTELTLESRERENERVDVDPISDWPLTLKVESERSRLAAQVAYYLAVATGGALSEQVDGEYLEAAIFRDRLGDFNAEAALTRASDYISRRT